MENIDIGTLISNPLDGDFTFLNFRIYYDYGFELQLQILGLGFYIEYISPKMQERANAKLKKFLERAETVSLDEILEKE